MRRLEGHSDYVTSIRYSSDRSLILSASLDKTMRLWKSDGGSCLSVLEGSPYGLKFAWLSADRGFAVSGDTAGNITLWVLDWELRPEFR